MSIDTQLADLEGRIRKSQLTKAIARLQAHFESLDNDHQRMALLEKIHLIAGNRRMKQVNVRQERRHEGRK